MTKVCQICKGVSMIVMKFGGSSVANAERIKHVASIITAYKEKRPAVVLSAMGDTTDHLLEAADQAVKGIVDVEPSILGKLLRNIPANCSALSFSLCSLIVSSNANN